MARSYRAVPTVLAFAAGAMLLVAPSAAQAQRRRDPRVAVAAQQRPEPPQTDPRRYPGPWYGNGDPRGRPGQWEADRSRQRHDQGPTVIYVPVPADYGYGYAGSYGYYGARPFGMVTDANGRPLSAGYEQAPPTGGYGYTPDLSGSPYAVSDEGLMVVDLPSGERRAFPSCAQTSDQRDPQGRPRTIFYQSTDYWMVLRPGQRGRVHGEPPAGSKACYAIDTTGKVVLRY